MTHPHPEVRAALSSWLEQRLDVEGAAEVARVFGVHAVPTLLALDGDGRILGRRTGFVEPAALVAWLKTTRVPRPEA